MEAKRDSLDAVPFFFANRARSTASKTTRVRKIFSEYPSAWAHSVLGPIRFTVSPTLLHPGMFGG